MCSRTAQIELFFGFTAALSVSLFHFRAAQAVTANWLFSALAVPNVLKEVIGWKTQ